MTPREDIGYKILYILAARTSEDSPWMPEDQLITTLLNNQPIIPNMNLALVKSVIQEMVLHSILAIKGNYLSLLSKSTYQEQYEFAQKLIKEKQAIYNSTIIRNLALQVQKNQVVPEIKIDVPKVAAPEQNIPVKHTETHNKVAVLRKDAPILPQVNTNISQAKTNTSKKTKSKFEEDDSESSSSSSESSSSESCSESSSENSDESSDESIESTKEQEEKKPEPKKKAPAKKSEKKTEKPKPKPKPKTTRRKKKEEPSKKNLGPDVFITSTGRVSIRKSYNYD